MALKGSTCEEQIWNFLKGKIGNDYGVAGLMGNLYAESGLNPTNLQNSYEKKLGYTDSTYTQAVDNGSYTNFIKDSAGYGLAQWTYWSRKEKLLNFVKSRKCSVGNLEAQLDFLIKELSESYGTVLAKLKSARSVKVASDVVLTEFERPKDQSNAVKEKRASYGQKYYDEFVSNEKKEDSKEEDVNKFDILKVGDVVNFTGSIQYTSSYSGGTKKSAKSCQARITAISNGRPHPYHLVALSGSKVYGWCDVDDIEGISGSNESSLFKVGDNVSFTGEKQYTSSYAGATEKPAKPCKAKITAMNKNGKYPYHVVGDMVHGWVNTSDIGGADTIF